MTGRVLVTGAALRVGRAIAGALAAAGYKIAIHCRNSAKDADEFAAALNAKYGTGWAVTARADLANDAETDALIPGIVKTHGNLTGLVNSASVFEDDRIETVNRAHWDKHLTTNLFAPVILSQAFAAQLPPDAQGSIVNIVDQGVLKLTPQFFSYTVSKTGLWTVTQTMAQALAPRIRVNAIGPGPTLASIHQDTKGFAAQAAATPLQRPSTPQDIAAAVVYLMGANAVTGTMIPVDSGQHLNWRTADVEHTKAGSP
jgi:NAD(P)-dependent dehydrogenase (short-subunit alcohol dehydrogenase family)